MVFDGEPLTDMPLSGKVPSLHTVHIKDQSTQAWQSTGTKCATTHEPKFTSGVTSHMHSLLKNSNGGCQHRQHFLNWINCLWDFAFSSIGRVWTLRRHIWRRQMNRIHQGHIRYWIPGIRKKTSATNDTLCNENSSLLSEILYSIHFGRKTSEKWRIRVSNYDNVDHFQ